MESAMIPEYNTTNCQEFHEYWKTDDDSPFACKICGEPWPNKVRIYHNHISICGDKHKKFHRIYAILEKLEHELLGDHFNALTVALKLNEEGMLK